MKQEIERITLKVYQMTPYALAFNAHGIELFKVHLTVYDDNGQPTETIEYETNQRWNLLEFKYDPVLFFTVEDGGKTLSIHATRNLEIERND